MSAMIEDYKKLEILVANIQSQLAPNADVIHDVKLRGHDSEVDRQIDVLVRQSVGQYEMKIVIDTKDYKKPVDVKGVEEFHGLVKDVRAQKGVLVCPSGFSKAAKTLAAKLEIALYSPVDTDPHKWQVIVKCPVVIDFRDAKMSFGLATSTSKPFMMSPNFWSEATAFTDEGRKLGNPLQYAMQKWNTGAFPTETGLHEGMSVFDEKTVHTDNGYGECIPVDLTVSFLVSSQLFWGHVNIEDLSGFLDHETGEVITNAFTTGDIDPDDVWENWQRIESIEDVPVPPTFGLKGLVGWCE